MDREDINFPSIKKSIEDFINDEDGNITRGKLATIGAMIMVMTLMFGIDVEAKHRSHSSHSSHRSHSSHSSTSYHRSHSSHSDHGSHGSHDSHSSHTSHSNTSTHSNSLYSSEGDVQYGPNVSSIASVDNSTSSISEKSVSVGEGFGSISEVQSIQGAQSNMGFEVEDISVSDVLLPEIPTMPDVPTTIPPGDFQAPNFETPFKIYNSEED